MTKLIIKKTAKLKRIAIPMLQKLERGDEVKWSGMGSESDHAYVVLNLNGNIVHLVDENGNEVDAFDYEVTLI